MRLPWTALVLVGFAFFAAPQADAGAIYKMRATKTLKDYYELELTFEGSKVFGQARPARGYPTPSPIEVTGTNVAEGVVELTFHLRKPERRTFKKIVDDRDITWTSGSDHFRRPRQGELSDADRALNVMECGPLHRSMRFWPLKGASKEQLPPFLSGNPAIAELPVVIHEDARGEEFRERRLPLGAALHELWPREDGNRNFEVPVGTEATVAIALRQSGFMGADLGEGGCGPMDPPARFIHSRTFFFEGGTFLKDKFVAFMDESLNAFAGKDRSGRSFDYAIENAAVSTLTVAPFTSSYRARMRLASEVSRQVQGRWDSFEVAFEPAELILNTRSDYSVVVTVRKVRSADRSTGRYVPFRNGQTQAGDEIEAALVVLLSQRVKDGRCEHFSQYPIKVTCEARRPRRAEP